MLAPGTHRRAHRSGLTAVALTDPAGPRTGFLLDPASPLHDTGWGHPEHQGRLRALASAVEKALPVLNGHVEQVENRAATDDDLLRVHSSTHVERVRTVAQESIRTKKLLRLDEDTVVSPASWNAAVGSSGAVIEACRRVADGGLRTAFVAARPPGHHATPERAMGFCLFNHVAVGARWLQHAGKADRVLILDWDVHHGNGTQDIFLEDPSVFFCSLHQFPHWPGSGHAGERGIGRGEGFTLNVPLAPGTPAPHHRRAFTESLDRIADVFKPDFVLCSAGFDCLAGDPLGGLLLEPEDLHAMTREVVERAREWCDGKVVASLEGGYDPKRTGQGAAQVIRALAELPDSP